MIISNVLNVKILSTNGGKKEDGRYFFSITYRNPFDNSRFEEDSFTGLTEERYNQMKDCFKKGDILKKTISWEKK